MTFRCTKLIGLALLALAGCGDDGESDAAEPHTDECPSELSYALTGKPFLDDYCMTCHATAVAKVVGDGHDFSSEALVREHGSMVYEQVMTGAMPKSGPRPSEAEKRDFLEWLECSGAAAAGDGHNHSHE